MKKNEVEERKKHQHRGKFTEGLLDSQVILKALNIKAGQTILDAGCGNGYMSMLFSGEVSQSGKVYALDTNESFIKALRNEINGTNIEAIVGDITAPTRIKQSSLDLIYISTVVHVFSQKQMQGFIREVRRLLKSDGWLAVVEIEKKETPFGPPLRLRYSPEELKKTIPMVPGKTLQVGEHFYLQFFQNKENSCN